MLELIKRRLDLGHVCFSEGRSKCEKDAETFLMSIM